MRYAPHILHVLVYTLLPPAFGLDPELTGLPGVRSAVGIHSSGRGPVLEARSSMLAGFPVPGSRGSSGSGYQKAQSAGWCWPAAPLLRGPPGLLEEVLLIEVAGTEVLRLRGVAT